MSTRRQGQTRVNSVPVTATITRELLESLDALVDQRRFSSRSDAINRSIDLFLWLLEHKPELIHERIHGIKPVSRAAQLPQQPNPPPPDTSQYYPH